MNYRTIKVRDYGKDWGAGRYGVTADCGRHDGEGDVSEGTNDTNEVIAIFDRFMAPSPEDLPGIPQIEPITKRCVSVSDYPKAGE